MSEKYVVLLKAEVSGDKVVKANQDALEQLLFVKQIPFMPIDGTDSVNKDIRTRLWEISGQKLKYPQLFLYDKAEDAYEFLGDWSTIHKKNERNDVDGSFDDMFADLDPYVPSRSMYAAETDAASPNGKNYDPQRRSDEDGEDGDEAEDSREPASATTASSAAAATPRSEWDECLSSRGETYWFNRKTHESSWVDPRSGIGADGVWIPQIDAKGRTYYYNRRNGKSSWSVPVAQ